MQKTLDSVLPFWYLRCDRLIGLDVEKRGAVLAGDHLTILIFSRNSSSVRRYRIPKWIVRSVVVVCPVLIVLAGILGFSFSRSPHHASLIGRFQTENKTQQNQIRALSESIAQVQNRIAQMKEFDSRLRVIANLEHMPSSLFGVGGPLSEDIREKTRSRQGLEATVGSLESSSGLSTSQDCPDNKQRHLLQGLVHNTWGPWPHIPCLWPSQGWIIGGFGCRFSPQTGRYELHEGVEISNSSGTPVVAPADGLVTTIGTDPTYGRMIVMSHGHGVVTRYGHLGETNVTLGEKIQRGRVIGKMGSTGHSMGPHLYYEVRVNGIPTDPRNYLYN